MSSSFKNVQQRIVTAPWLITMNGPSIKDGAVLLDSEKVLEVGEVARLAKNHPDLEVEYFSGVLMPALVNAHMHLELSHLPQSLPLAPEKHFVDWVEELLEKRFATKITAGEVENAAVAVIDQQYDSGVILIGDIGNTPVSESWMSNTRQVPEIYYMQEMLGSSKDAVVGSLKQLEQHEPDVHVTAHAPYSTRPELLKKIKERCDTHAHIFSIHTAEVKEERDFIQSGSGIFYDFLIKRGSWSDDYFDGGLKASTTVEYFAKLGLLSKNTLLVHCVHVTLSDIELIKKSGAHICICPGSNEFLHAGKVPLEDMIKTGLLPAIGTDSSASNQVLDMWQEMRLIHENYPAILPTEIIAMATRAGARVFGKSDTYGVIAQGKTSHFLHVSGDEIKNCITENDLLKVLVANGRPENIEWIPQSLKKKSDN